jgi:hypothetical protein
MGYLKEATFTGDGNRVLGKRSVSLCGSSVRGTGGMAPLLETLKLGLSITLRHARKLISGPSPTTKTRLLSFNKTQTRVINGLITEHTLGRHLHLMGLTNSPFCRRCGVEEETSAHVWCECEALASL